MDLFYKIEDISKLWLLNKIVDLFNKIVDLLFREGGSSAPREPPLAMGLIYYGLCTYNFMMKVHT